MVKEESLTSAFDVSEINYRSRLIQIYEGHCNGNNFELYVLFDQ